MIELDRDAPLPLADQLVEGLRYEIAAGRYRPGARLPSTRALAEQIGISFHTVRKAYQRLAEDGTLDVRRGGGYHVAERPSLSRTDRLERAAGVVQDALRQLVGLGLSDDEVDYVFQEQIQFFERPGPKRSLYFAAAYRELAESGAEHATSALQERVLPITFTELQTMETIDGLVTPLADLRNARQRAPGTEIVGVPITYPLDVLERAARLDTSEAIGLVTRQPDAVPSLSDTLRSQSGYAGQIMGLPVEADRRQLETVLQQATLVIYTPQARRRIRPLLQRMEITSAELAPSIPSIGLSRIREALGV
ncbi:MAG: GntR family transcriptional regulator [Bacteroidota bacterium]